MNNLANSIATILTEKKLTLSTAESCSAGGLSFSICSVPGSSIYFLGGVIAYSNKSKHRELNVNLDDLRKHSEVSEVIAKQMSIGVKNRFNSEIPPNIFGWVVKRMVGGSNSPGLTLQKTLFLEKNAYSFVGFLGGKTSTQVHLSLNWQELGLPIFSYTFENALPLLLQPIFA